MKDLIEQAESVVVIQAENPDADSLASSLALEQLLAELDIETTLYCPVNIPRHLRHIPGWDRVVDQLPTSFSLSIIVDATRMTLLSKVFTPEQEPILTSRPIVVIDHHDLESDIPFEVVDLSDKTAASAGQVIFQLAEEYGWQRNSQANDMIVVSIMADTLGLTTAEATAQTFKIMAQLVEDGVAIHELDEKRRHMMRRPAEITEYKGRLLQRVEYSAHGALATITIPWEEIEAFSDTYNPSNLVIDDMRLTEGVRVAIAYKLYPDGHLTGKIRCNADAPVAAKIAESQGGGGHQYAAGFKVYDADFEAVKSAVVKETMKLLKEVDG